MKHSDRLPLVATDSQKESAKIVGTCLLAAIVIILIAMLTGCGGDNFDRAFADGIMGGGTRADVKAPAAKEEAPKKDSWFSMDEMRQMAFEMAAEEEKVFYKEYLEAYKMEDSKDAYAKFEAAIKAAGEDELASMLISAANGKLAVAYDTLKEKEPTEENKKAAKDATQQWVKDFYSVLRIQVLPKKDDKK